jgi:hypothetical protein
MYMKQIGQMLSADAIRQRMRIELGEGFDKPSTLTYAHSGAAAVQTIAPLGVLFHITAGNVDGLPFISLLDGLLTCSGSSRRFASMFMFLIIPQRTSMP